MMQFDTDTERDAFQEVITRHQMGRSENDIRTAFLFFLEKAGVAALGDMRTEDRPAPSSNTRYDLYVHNTCIEFKRDIIQAGRINQGDIDQIDGYIRTMVKAGAGVQNGILTDGVNYLIRRIGDDTLPLSRDNHHVFDKPEQAPRLREYLHGVISAPASDVSPTEGNLTRHFGLDSDTFRAANTLLMDAHRENRDHPTVAVKRKLWQELLQVALGQDSVSDDESNDWLYVRHTYLTTLVGVIVQAHFDIDVVRAAENSPDELVNGDELRRNTNLKGIIESDLFNWPLEVGQTEYIAAIAKRVATFDWKKDADELAATLYQNAITADERKKMGEYYTPRWLANAIVRETIPEPTATTTLDPACGSGTFLEAVMRHILANAPEGATGESKLAMLQYNVAGIDLHPVAVQLAKATWVVNAVGAITEARAENPNLPEITAPVHLGDSMQLRYDNSLITAQGVITLKTGETLPNESGEVVFEIPLNLAKDTDRFDGMIIDVADAIERGDDTDATLDKYGLSALDRETMDATVSSMKALHAVGRNHVWAYYLRNMTRPAVIAERKVDAIVGNPPWLTYRQSSDIIRAELREMSERRYGIWAGGKNSANQDVAGLFYCRSAELYLKEGGSIGMVMPHSALHSGQHLKFRLGRYLETVRGRGRNRRSPQSMGLDFSVKTPWDLESLEPNNFFPIPASVVFARLPDPYGDRDTSQLRSSSLAPGKVEIWSGPTGTAQVARDVRELHHDDGEFHSPYAYSASRGADIFDRRLYFVTTEPNDTLLAAPGTYKTYPEIGTLDKKKYSVDELKAFVVHQDNIFDVYLGESLAPYVALEPRKAILPVDGQTMTLPLEHNNCEPSANGQTIQHDNCAVDKTQLDSRMRARWEIMGRLWDENKGKNDKRSLSQNLNYINKLSGQLEYLRESENGITRIAYATSGRPTAALITDDKAILDTNLYQVACESEREAYYLLAIINSLALEKAVDPFMPKGQFGGSRHVHKHPWKLPIPKFDSGNDLHARLAKLGRDAESEACAAILELTNEGAVAIGYQAARATLRHEWQRTSETAAGIEGAVGDLLG